MKIKTNKAKCLECDNIIESKHRHDFRYCKCGALFVDGGKEYLRRGFNNKDRWVEMSEYYPETLKDVIEKQQEKYEQLREVPKS